MAPPPARAPLTRRSLHILLVAGVVYLFSAWYSAELLKVVGMPFRVDSEYLREHGVLYMSARIFVHAPTCLLIFWAMCIDPEARLRLSMRSERGWYLLLVGLVCAATSVVLDRLGWWPWVWRWNSSAFGFVASLVEHRAVAALMLLFIMFGFVIPFIEEAVFRVGFQDVFIRNGASPRGGVVMTSLAFTALHFGPSFRVYGQLGVHGVWVFLLACVLGTVTLQRDGKIAAGVCIHGAKNLMEQITAMLQTARLP